MGKNTENGKIERTIERVLSHQSRLAAITAEKKRLPPLDPAWIAASDANARLNSLLRQKGAEGHDDTTKRKVAKLRSLVEQTETAHENLKAQHDSLQAEEDHIRGELARDTLQCSVAEVLSFQGELAEIKKQKKLLETRLDAAQQAAETAMVGIPDLSELLERRENLLADIAIGVKTPKGALESLEAEISAQREQLDALEAAALQTETEQREIAAGLMRKLEQVTSREAELAEKIIPRGIACVLDAKAQAVAVDYCETAQKLIALSREIVGLGTLLKNYPGERDLGIRQDLYMFKIPGFDLDACKPFMATRFGEIFNFAPEPGGEPQAASEVREKMKEAGLDV